MVIGFCLCIGLFTFLRISLLFVRDTLRCFFLFGFIVVLCPVCISLENHPDLGIYLFQMFIHLNDLAGCYTLVDGVQAQCRPEPFRQVISECLRFYLIERCLDNQVRV